MLAHSADEARILARAIERTCAVLGAHDRQEVTALVRTLASHRGLDAESLAVQAITTLSPKFNIRRMPGIASRSAATRDRRSTAPGRP